MLLIISFRKTEAYENVFKVLLLRVLYKFFFPQEEALMAQKPKKSARSWTSISSNAALRTVFSWAKRFLDSDRTL